jgi:hypothetical protein
MPILKDSSVDDRKRLLELFPAANLRTTFQSKGAKEEICYAAAASTADDQLARVAEFVDGHFSCCKQHVYVFSHDGSLTLPDDVKDGEKVLAAGSHALYLSRVSYSVVLRDPLAESTLDFLWPIQIELRPSYVIVRFVVLEKNTSSYFDRPAYLAGKSLTDKIVLSALFPGEAVASDLNKGIKKLWADGYLESTRSNFKKPFSTSSETMDEEKGIKEHYPEIYSIMQESPLYTTLFQVNDNESSVDTFSADPSHGIIGFTSYSEKGDTDAIIEKIISNN